jgi:hypothetical protein
MKPTEPITALTNVIFDAARELKAPIRAVALFANGGAVVLDVNEFMQFTSVKKHPRRRAGLLPRAGRHKGLYVTPRRL